MYRNPSSISRRMCHGVVLRLVCAFLLFMLMPRLAAAHGGGTPRLTDVVAGPYRLFAWTQPEPLRAGDVHVTIGVTLAGEADAAPAADLLTQPVTDATVTMRFVAVDGQSETIERAAVLGGVGAVYYEADASLPTAGPWRFMIEVRGPAGEGRAEFTEEVLAARTVNGTLLAAGGVLFVLLIALIGLWNRRQQPTPRQESLVDGRAL
jgi:hypothetical protein